MLLKIPQVLDSGALRQARELLSAAAWVDGRSTAGPQAAQAKRNQQLDPATAAAQALRALVLQALDGHPLFFSAALPKRVLPPQFNRYEGDANHYGDHVDQAIRYAGHGGEQVGSLGDLVDRRPDRARLPPALLHRLTRRWEDLPARTGDFQCAILSRLRNERGGVHEMEDRR